MTLQSSAARPSRERDAIVVLGTSLLLGEQARALDVSQELKSKTSPLVRAFDDARNVGHDERPVVAELNDAKVGREGREGIVGDLRPRRRDRGEERRLPRIRLADQSDVRDKLELELQRSFLPTLAGLVLPRRLVRRRREVRVALPASATARDDDLVPRLDDLADELSRTGITDQRAGRNGQHHTGARPPGLVRARAVVAALGLPEIAICVVEERVQ